MFNDSDHAFRRRTVNLLFAAHAARRLPDTASGGGLYKAPALA